MMTIDYPLTLISIAFAYLALQDPGRRRQLLFRISPLAWQLVLAAVLVVHFFLFDQVWFAIGFPAVFGDFLWGFDDQLIAYSFTLAALVSLLISSFRKPVLEGSRLLHFGKYIEYLVDQNEPARALTLVREHAESAAKGLSRVSYESEEASSFRRVLSCRQISEQALLLEVEGIKALLQTDAVGQGGLVFRRWIEGATESTLARWLNDLGSEGRSASAECLLHLIADDPQMVTNRALYKPVGDWALQRIRTQVSEARNGGRPPLVSSTYEYRDPEDAVRILLGVLTFFDAVVSTAAEKQMNWHMWLFYLPHMAREAVAALEHMPDAGDDELLFENTGVGCLLGRIAIQCESWVELYRSVPEGSLHATPGAWDGAYENDNIPKSAAIAYGQVLAAVFEEEWIPENWKREFVGGQLYLLLRNNRLSDEWKRLMINGIVESMRRYRGGDPEVVDVLAMVEPVARIELTRLMGQAD